MRAPSRRCPAAVRPPLRVDRLWHRGPSTADDIFTQDLLRGAFGKMEILRREAYGREIKEGSGHNAMTGLIDLGAVKR